MLISESLKWGIPIVVETTNEKRRIAHKMYLRGQLGFSDPHTEEYYNNNLVFCVSENMRGKNIHRGAGVIIDANCENTIRVINENGIQINNGFLYIRYGV